MLDADAVSRAVSAMQALDCLVHCAALAHGQKPGAQETTFSTNVKMVQNLLAAFEQQPHWVFLSSVAVYGDRDHATVSTPIHPIDPYACSKASSEEELLASVPELDIVRLCPVYDETHLDDVRKRVFVPGTAIRLNIHPAPSHTLCNAESAAAQIADRVSRQTAGQYLLHVVDTPAVPQTELRAWFTGPAVTVPALAIKPLVILLDIMPFAVLRGVARNLRKLFWSVTYEPGSVEVGRTARPARE